MKRNSGGVCFFVQKYVRTLMVVLLLTFVMCGGQKFDSYGNDEAVTAKPTKVTLKKVLKLNRLNKVPVIPEGGNQKYQESQRRRNSGDNVPAATDQQKTFAAANFEEINDSFSRRRARFLFNSRVGK